jgi:hypothetical protein
MASNKQEQNPIVMLGLKGCTEQPTRLTFEGEPFRLKIYGRFYQAALIKASANQIPFIFILNGKDEPIGIEIGLKDRIAAEHENVFLNQFEEKTKVTASIRNQIGSVNVAFNYAQFRFDDKVESKVLASIMDECMTLIKDFQAQPTNALPR